MSAKGRDDETGHVRDRRNGKWWWCHNAIIDQYGPTLGPHGIAVYAALCRYASEAATCWPSVAKIAHDTGMSTNRVRLSLGDLEKVHLIEIEHRSRNKLNIPSIYTLLDVVEYFTTESTSSNEVLHDVKEGTSPDEVGVLHVVKEGTSPREDKEDSSKKTQLEKDLTKKSEAAKSAAPAPLPFEKLPEPAPPAKPDKPTRTRTQRVTPQGQTRRTPEELTLCEELVDGLCEVSAMLRQTNRDTLYDGGWRLVGLLEAGITPSKAHIIRAFGTVDPGPGVWWWYRDDQRVKIDLNKGRAAPRPNPRQVAEMYAISLQPLSTITAPPPTSSVGGYAMLPPAPTPAQNEAALAQLAASSRRAAETAEPMQRPTKTSRDIQRLTGDTPNGRVR